jgi:hypothetical protein
MEARTTKLNCTRSNSGDKLSQTNLTILEVKERIRQATGLTPEKLRVMLNMQQEGCYLEQTREEYRVELEVLKQFLTDPQDEHLQDTVVGFETRIDALADQGKGLYEISRLLGVSERAVLAYTLGSPDDCKTYTPPTTTEESKSPHKPQAPKTLPRPQHSHAFLYSCEQKTNKLQRVNLLTGELSYLKVPDYEFKEGCKWSELPGGGILITGGVAGRTVVREVVRIDTLRECAVSSVPPMHSAREDHAAVYHSQYVYVLGGYSRRYLRKCERYVCAESRWEVLPSLPVASADMKAVELENSMYALGGHKRRSYLDTVQKLSLDSLTWELMRLKLPQAVLAFPCFKRNTEVYLVINKTLYSFTPLEIKPIKTLDRSILCYSSYYSRGTLYCTWYQKISALALGQLN